LGSYAAERILLPARGEAEAVEIELRSCLAADAPLFEPFWRKVSRETTHTMQTPERVPDFSKTGELWQKSFDDPVEVRIGAFETDGGRMIGIAGLHADFGGHPWTRHIGQFGMMVLEEYWGRGVGRALLAAIERHARSVGIAKMEAHVRVENERGWKLYRSFGYRIEGTRSRAARIAGRFQDEYWIAKDLDASTPSA
jgi:RimJ/RimL family protein N-acetyltransferase